MGIASVEPMGPPIYSTLADDADLAALVALYVNEMPQRLEQFDRLFDDSQWDGLRRLAHQMKGAAGSYGFDVVTEYAARLEKALAEAKPRSEVVAALEELKGLCARLHPGLPS